MLNVFKGRHNAGLILFITLRTPTPSPLVSNFRDITFQSQNGR